MRRKPTRGGLLWRCCRKSFWQAEYTEEKSGKPRRRRSGRLKLTTSKENVYEFNEKCALTKNMHLASIISHTDTNNCDKDRTKHFYNFYNLFGIFTCEKATYSVLLRPITLLTVISRKKWKYYFNCCKWYFVMVFNSLWNTPFVG